MSQVANVWNDIFKKNGRVFTEPHEDMKSIAQELKNVEAKTILDFGSGSGRHVVYYAQHGFSVYGLDIAPDGLEMTRDWLASEGLSADLKLHSMTDPLPYTDSFFDAVISVQVIHHANINTIKQIVLEIHRVLKTGGLAFVTVPEINHHKDTIEIEPKTFMPTKGEEAGLPHHYFTLDELYDTFNKFESVNIHTDSVNHFCLLARKH